MYNKRCKRLQFCKESTRTEKWLGVIGELGNSWWTEDLWDVWGDTGIGESFWNVNKEYRILKKNDCI